MMVTNKITALTWDQLISPKMIGSDILVEYIVPESINYPLIVKNIIRQDATIIGTAYIGDEHVLLVYSNYADDIYIIKREGIGTTWEAYKEVEEDITQNVQIS